MRCSTLVGLATLLCWSLVRGDSGEIQPLQAQLTEIVVPIGIKKESGEWKTVGTGFLMASYESTPKLLVTNRHVLDTITAHSTVKGTTSAWVKVRLEPGIAEKYGKGPGSWAEFVVTLSTPDRKEWTAHPDPQVDIAVMYFPPMDSAHLKLWNSCEHLSISLSSCGYHDSLTVGDEVVFFGFPLGLGARARPTPIMRSGMIALLDSSHSTILLDAQVFGGSSGSPVISTGYFAADPGPYKGRRVLVGIVSGFRPAPLRYGMAKLQSSSPSQIITFPVENAGLATVFSTDLILETIEAHHERLGPRIRKILDSLGFNK